MSRRIISVVSLVLLVGLGTATFGAGGAEQAKDNAISGRKKPMGVEKASFGKTKDGTEVFLYTCTNENGLVLKLTNYGATVVAVETPDKAGKLANITLGFKSLDGYLQR